MAHGATVSAFVEKHSFELQHALALSSLGKMSNESFISYVQENCDPTNGSYLFWIVKNFMNRRLSVGDLESTKSVLLRFEKNKRNLDTKYRDIQKYNSIKSISDILDKYCPSFSEGMSSRQIKDIKKSLVYEETVMLRDDDVATVAVPMTEHSARWWSRDTDWDLKSTSKNPFQSLVSKASHFVVDFHDGVKWLFQMSDEGGFCIDRNSKPVSISDIEERWDIVSSLIVESAKRWLGAFQFIPSGKLTDDIVVGVASEVRDLDLLIRFHEENSKYFTNEIYEKIISNNGNFIFNIPKNSVTESLMLKAVISSPRVISEFFRSRSLKDMVTREMCVIAVVLEPSILRSLPRNFLDENFILFALNNKNISLSFIPMALRTESICRIALAKCGNDIKYVPDDVMSEELYMIARRTMTPYNKDYIKYAKRFSTPSSESFEPSWIYESWFKRLLSDAKNVDSFEGESPDMTSLPLKI